MVTWRYKISLQVLKNISLICSFSTPEKRNNLLCRHSNIDLSTCGDNMLFFTCEDVTFLWESKRRLILNFL